MSAPNPYSTPRHMTCARCGASFDCGGADCWCAEESQRLPMPTDPAATCLCPTCLRQAAANHADAGR